MTMVLDGNGTITGLVAGGLPDATVTAADLSGAQTGSAPVFGARAWCTFNGGLTGTNAPTAGGNVTSVTRVSTGVYTINFTTTMPDSSFCISSSTSGGGINNGTKTTSSCTLSTFLPATGVALDASEVSVAIFR